MGKKKVKTLWTDKKPTEKGLYIMHDLNDDVRYCVSVRAQGRGLSGRVSGLHILIKLSQENVLWCKMPV